MNISEKKIRLFQQKIFQFYQMNRRNLPWRNTKNPYDILVSEMMLQQTQVSRVIEYYLRWIDRWPTICHLADASFEEVLKQWMGLGYNRRAKYLHRTASIICNKYNGDVLTALDSYQELPGIGIYTSSAVKIFAANEDIVTIDTNIRRILINEFNLPHSVPNTDVKHIAQRCLPKGRSRDWHNALMDYGALYLTSQKSGISPVTKQSAFHGSNRQIRGIILRQILREPQSVYSLHQELKLDSDRFQEIINSLIDDDLLIEDNGVLKLPTK